MEFIQEKYHRLLEELRNQNEKMYKMIRLEVMVTDKHDYLQYVSEELIKIVAPLADTVEGFKTALFLTIMNALTNEELGQGFANFDNDINKLPIKQGLVGMELLKVFKLGD